MFLASTLPAQVRLSTNLLKTIPLQRPVIFEVRLEKASIGNFTRFQLDVPPGLSIEEVDSRGGTFSFDESKVKIIWVTTPPDADFSIRMKLLPVKQGMNCAFLFRYFYVESDLKKEWVSQEYKVVFRDTVMPVLFSAPMVDLQPKGDKPVAAGAPARNASVAGKTPEQIRQQVDKMRREALEAKTVGEREKQNAMSKLSRAEKDEKKVLAQGAGSADNTELARIREEKKNAAVELIVAERVLLLSHTLDSTANEIEKLNRDLNPRLYTSGSKQKQTNVKTTAVPSSTTKYRVQVGSFKDPPRRSNFKNLGKVSVLHEGGVYKVLVGDYAEKADAYELRDRLNTRTPGCFVVTFVNGERVN